MKIRKYPLDKSEWRGTGGGFTVYVFENVKTGEIHEIRLKDELVVPLSSIYELVELVDHLELEEAVKESTIEPDPELFIQRIEELRKLVREVWKKKYTGDLPHL
jgi:hypothetical protein